MMWNLVKSAYLPLLYPNTKSKTTGRRSSPKSLFFLGINIIPKDSDPIFFINFDQFLC